MDTELNFGTALNYIKAGEKVARENWNGNGQFVFLVKNGETTAVDPKNPDFGNAEKNDYLCIKTVDDKLVPWFPSQTDILADDWFTIDDM